MSESNMYVLQRRGDSDNGRCKKMIPVGEDMNKDGDEHERETTSN